MKKIGATSKGRKAPARKPAERLRATPSRSIRPRVGGAVKSTLAYAGAAVNRLTEDWPMQILSADGATRWTLRQLRARARDLERNGAVAERFLSALEVNVIGSSGVGLHLKIKEARDRIVTDPTEQVFLKALQMKAEALTAERRAALAQTGDHAGALAVKCARTYEVKGDQMLVGKGQPDRYANAVIEAAWEAAGKRGQWDVTGKHSRNDFWRLTLRTSARDGDGLILCYRGFPNRAGLGWQLIEGDYLDDYYNVDLPNGNTVRMGVELDRFRRKVAFWILAKHPGDYGIEGMYSYDGKRLRIPALGCEPEAPVHLLHVSRSKRAEETRAVPWLAPAMPAIKMLEGYEEAELTAARAEACKHVFFQREAFGTDGEPLAWGEGVNGELVDDMAPGGSTELPPGVTANVYDPKHPNTAYPEFVKSVKRKISSALNCAYNTLFVDLESVSYSSIRAGVLDERENWKIIQSWFCDDVVLPSFEHWLELQLLTGALPFRMSDFDRLNAPDFRFRRWPWVDPKNDAETAELMLKNRLTTRTRIISDMSGEDFEETIDELDYEEGYIAEKLNLAPPLPVVAPAPPVTPEEPEPAAEPEPEPFKSAFMGDVNIVELPAQTQADIARFQPCEPGHRVARYGMTVPELVDKADQHNLAAARHHLRNAGVAASADEVHARRDKHILLLNDRIIDGHHHLAKAERGKVTSSLPVLDLSPLRYQQPGVPDAIKGALDQLRDSLGRFASGGSGLMRAPDKGGEGGGGAAEPSRWIDSAPGLPADTKAHHSSPEGGYTPERSALHDQIASKFIGGAAPVADDETPTAILMMGGPASGKSTFANAADNGSFVRVDADKVKRELPEYQAAVSQRARNAAEMAHEESSDLAKRIGAEAVATRRNLIYDGTGANREKYEKLIGNLKEKGYHVKLIAAHIPLETALGRGAIRAEKEGRKVPEPFIRDTYHKIPGNYAHNSSLADEAELWDNSGEEPVLAAEKGKDGTVIEHNPDLLDKHGYR